MECRNCKVLIIRQARPGTVEAATETRKVQNRKENPDLCRETILNLLIIFSKYDDTPLEMF